jgi:hypothetical protein
VENPHIARTIGSFERNGRVWDETGTGRWSLKFNPDTGALAIDSAFHDDRGKPGFDFDNREWPHGWTGSAIAHGVVFSR